MVVPALNLKDTDAEPGRLSTAALDFEDLGGRITGTGGSLHTQIRSGAKEFSDLIAEPIRDLAEKNRNSWQSAVQGATWGAAVTSAWSGNVTEFRERRKELLTRWSAGQVGDFGVTMDQAQPGMAEVKAAERFHKEVDAAAEAEHTAIMGEFRKIWQKLETDAGERTAELKSGPNKTTLATLMDTGALGWAGFNLWGAQSPTPLDGGDGTALAKKFLRYLKDGELPPGSTWADFNALMAHAAFLQKNGGKLTAGEREFLSEFYEYLNREGREDRTSQLFRHEFWNGEEGGELRALMGNGLLALSDEKIGGGIEYLPGEVRQTLENGEFEHDPLHKDGPWLGLVPLAGLVAAAGGVHAKVRLKGGKDFSALMTLRLTESVDGLGRGEDLELARQALSVVFRNDEAKGALLTGEYDDAARFGEHTPEAVMRNLFGADWGDDGKTAAGLIDWIPDGMDSKDDKFRDLATRSAFSVYTTITNPEPTIWKTSALEWATDGFGKVGSDPAAPMASRNPAVAGALGDMIGHDLDEVFAASAEGAKNGLKGGEITLDWDTRERLFQIAMADKSTADTLGKTIYAQVINEAGGVEKWSPGEAGGYGEKNGTLTRLLDEGLARLKADTGEGLNEAADAAKGAKDDQRIVRWGNMGAAVLKEAVLAVPGVDRGSDALKLGTKILFELAKTAPGAANTEGWWMQHESGTGISGEASAPGFSSFNGQVTRAAVDGGGVTVAGLGKSLDALDDKVRGGLEIGGLVGDDGKLREWKDIAPDQRRAATAVFTDVLTEAEREALNKYVFNITGERLWK
ncbi:hypothetical protein AB0I28_16620 [Phytomonospora sp. NPDC050363]|uniref:TPR repeat region-containing protein n=1 Tax=Phytomonospora sp. NPDC050363 TaxID=3155642 RepID=UPI0033D6BAD9